MEAQWSAHQAQKQQGVNKKRQRRGGWHPKARLYELYGREGEGAEAWEHDCSRSSLWLYIHAPEGRYWDRVFVKSLGVPRKLYRQYVKLLESTDDFKTHEVGSSKRGRGQQPLEMKVLSWLMVLTSGCAFHVAARECCLSESVVRKFFHRLNAWLVQHEYGSHVYPPTSNAEITRTERVFSLMGFPGAITTIDATHVAWNNCPSQDRWRNTGKEGFPTRSFNCAVGPWLEFHHVHKSHPGAHNDKTISRFDAFMQALKRGTLYGAYSFALKTANGTDTMWSGLYAIVDGGYHAWRCLMYPNKKTAQMDAMRWSKRMESVRKCSERAFGVLKKRFGILGHGFNLTSRITARQFVFFQIRVILEEIKAL